MFLLSTLSSVFNQSIHIWNWKFELQLCKDFTKILVCIWVFWVDYDSFMNCCCYILTLRYSYYKQWVYVTFKLHIFNGSVISTLFSVWAYALNMFIFKMSFSQNLLIGSMLTKKFVYNYQANPKITSVNCNNSHIHVYHWAQGVNWTLHVDKEFRKRQGHFMVV